MGHHSNIDWDLLNDLSEMVERGLLDEGSGVYRLVMRMIDGEIITPAERAVFDSEYVSLAEKLHEEQESERMQHLLSKDD